MAQPPYTILPTPANRTRARPHTLYSLSLAAASPLRAKHTPHTTAVARRIKGAARLKRRRVIKMTGW